MNKIIVFDIETIKGNQAIVDSMRPVFEEPKTKTAKSAADKMAEWEEESALHAERAEIAMIGVLDGDSNDFTALHGDEKTMLTEWWNLVEENRRKDCYFVGFNSSVFDIPFLIRRSWVNGVRVPAWVFTGKWIADAFIDLMKLWACGEYKYFVSLDTLAKTFGMSGKTGSGADFGALLASDKEAAIKYCEADCRITMEIAKRML